MVLPYGGSFMPKWIILPIAMPSGIEAKNQIQPHAGIDSSKFMAQISTVDATGDTQETQQKQGLLTLY